MGGGEAVGVVVRPSPLSRITRRRDSSMGIEAGQKPSEVTYWDRAGCVLASSRVRGARVLLDEVNKSTLETYEEGMWLRPSIFARTISRRRAERDVSN